MILGGQEKKSKNYRSDGNYKITHSDSVSHNLPILHSSNLTPFQSNTLSIVHSFNLTLFQSYTLAILQPCNLTLL